MNFSEERLREKQDKDFVLFACVFKNFRSLFSYFLLEK